MYFSRPNSNMLLQFLYHIQFLCDTIFLNVILMNLVLLSRHQYVLIMAEAINYILNIVWVWKLTTTKTEGMLSPIRESQTVQSETCTDKYWQYVLHEEHCFVCGEPNCVVISFKCCVLFLVGFLCKRIVYLFSSCQGSV